MCVVCPVIATPVAASDWLCLLKDPDAAVFLQYPFLFPLELKADLLKIYSSTARVKQLTECFTSACLRETLLMTVV